MASLVANIVHTHIGYVVTPQMNLFIQPLSFVIQKRTIYCHCVSVGEAYHGWLYFLDKNCFLEESDYLNGKLPDKISS